MCAPMVHSRFGYKARVSAALLAACALHLACSREGAEAEASLAGAAQLSGERWIHLARGFVPRAGDLRAEEREVLGGGGLAITGGASGSVIRCVLKLDREGWSARGGGLWSAALPIATRNTSASSERALPVLRSEGATIPCFAHHRLHRLLSEAPTGLVDPLMLRHVRGALPAFSLVGGRIHLFREPGSGRPDEMELSFELSLGRPVEGTWRVVHENLAAFGIPVLPGASEEVVTAIPPESSLRFSTLAIGGAAQGSSVRFRVSLEDELLFESECAVKPAEEPMQHEVPLPPAGRGRARLRFEVLGGFALTSFLNPTIGPAQIGAPGERAREQAHPDIVLLMGDTFRADNLSAWGGDAEIAPALNRAAERARCFTAARAPATSTLPSHASLFTSLYPPRTGVRSGLGHLGADAHTLAEHLRAVGYRTVAITDAGFVSWNHGLDQGFELFEQGREPEFGPTLEAIDRCLEADDGRPLFLFVHSYRAHDPYEVSGRTRARLGERSLLGSEEFDELARSALRSERHSERGESISEGVEVIQKLEALYRGASADAAEGFGRIIERLESAGVVENAILVFAADHGEAFGENGVLGHGKGVWDATALVPLWVRAPGLAPGAVSAPMSLIDLAPTLASLAGVEPHPGWRGRDCSGAYSAGPVFSFTGKPESSISEVAVVLGQRKLIFEARDGPGELLYAYRLDVDPGEHRNEVERSWARDLAVELRGPLERLFAEAREGQATALTPALRGQLEGLGYIGD